MDTTPQATWSVEISHDIAQAVWAAMQDDDDLASEFLDYALCFALTHYMDAGCCEGLKPDRHAWFHYSLEQARKRLKAGGDEMAERWLSYKHT